MKKLISGRNEGLAKRFGGGQEVNDVGGWWRRVREWMWFGWRRARKKRRGDLTRWGRWWLKSGTEEKANKTKEEWHAKAWIRREACECIQITGMPSLEDEKQKKTRHRTSRATRARWWWRILAPKPSPREEEREREREMKRERFS